MPRKLSAFTHIVTHYHSLTHITHTHTHAHKQTQGQARCHLAVYSDGGLELIRVISYAALHRSSQSNKNAQRGSGWGIFRKVWMSLWPQSGARMSCASPACMPTCLAPAYVSSMTSSFSWRLAGLHYTRGMVL